MSARGRIREPFMPLEGSPSDMPVDSPKLVHSSAHRGISVFMSRSAGTVLAEALALDERARASIARALLDSLSDESDGDASECETEWANVLRRRAEELRSGAVRPVPWDEVRDEMRALIREREG